MILNAKSLIPKTKVNRTIASKIDTLTGNIGEFVFAQYFFGDFKENSVGSSKGKIDFPGIEIKASAFPFNQNLNLLIREDYANKRHPLFYVQIIIDVDSSKAEEVLPGTKAYLAGYATDSDVKEAKLKDFGSKIGKKGGYKCYYIPMKDLKKMSTFATVYKETIDNEMFYHYKKISWQWK